MKYLLIAFAATALIFAGCGDDGKGKTASAGSQSGPTAPTAQLGKSGRTCTGSGKKSDFNGKKVVGKSANDAVAIAKRDGMKLRAVYIDDVPQTVTMDFREDRINVVITDGVVTAFCGVY